MKRIPRTSFVMLFGIIMTAYSMGSIDKAKKMSRVAILGSPGAGKTTIADFVCEKLNLSLYHLDQYSWLPGWQPVDYRECGRTHNALCDKDEWIIEGMGTRFLEYRITRADTIIFLDIPLWRCLYRVFKRAIMCYGTVPRSNTPGCPQRMPSLDLLAYIWRFHREFKPQIIGLLEKYKDEKQIFVIKNDKDIEELIKMFD